MERPIGPDGKPIPTQEEISSQMENIRGPYAELFKAMEYKASARAYKGGWRGRSTISGVWNDLLGEIEELKDELFYRNAHTREYVPYDVVNYDKVLHECADVANYLAVIADLVKEIQEQQSLSIKEFREAEDKYRSGLKNEAP